MFIVPFLQRKSESTIIARDKKGIVRSYPVHPHWTARWLILLVTTWGLLARFVVTLGLSVGWADPFKSVSWYGINAPGWFFDLVYARANNQPNGAHLVSFIGDAAFGLIICYKAHPLSRESIKDLLGDPFQGTSGALFLAGVHELLWIGFYYAAYWEYLSWSIAVEVLRDISFVGMMVLFILAFWKYPNRIVPLSIFKKPILAYALFLVGWFFVPGMLGYHLFPITTLNNTNFGIGVYEETPWFSYWWVNALEVISWLILIIPFVGLSVRYHKVQEE